MRNVIIGRRPCIICERLFFNSIFNGSAIFESILHHMDSYIYLPQIVMPQQLIFQPLKVTTVPTINYLVLVSKLSFPPPSSNLNLFKKRVFLSIAASVAGFQLFNSVSIAFFDFASPPHPFLSTSM